MANKSKDQEIVVLIVGGVRYQTFRSTLTTYPDTLLGTMFQERNKDLLHPANNNEYFFDRNELELELDYFQIPVENVKIDWLIQNASNNVDKFVEIFEKLIEEHYGLFIDRIILRFYETGYILYENIVYKHQIHTFKHLAEMKINYFNLLNIMGKQLACYFQSKYSEIKLNWRCYRAIDFNRNSTQLYKNIYMKLQINFTINSSKIKDNSCIR
ncbi:1137_t:CDS:2 [Entrophospora sp. SA101]|nr:3033_t:CDS:2 [Entrophospora candida]CAH1763498.1 841_t:CDS:2 [Entrophospora sp. SA101]CAG8531041.1 3458_t:CDS:2 [Entrophospora candida]CAJ0638159.1 1137_t:CDS:2 [Entrophospora sp. SA101]CAJ0828863.1 13759_t:CDS:2 [Entrophospora sp. SA101]